MEQVRRVPGALQRVGRLDRVRRGTDAVSLQGGHDRERRHASSNLTTFVIASVLSRGMRFFLVAALLWYFGEPIRRFIDRNLGWLTILFFALLLGGFLAVRLL